MKLVKPQSISSNYKALYEGAFLRVAFRAFVFKLIIATATMISIHVALAFISLVPALSGHIVISYLCGSSVIALGYCWTQYTDMLDAKQRHMRNLFK